MKPPAELQQLILDALDWYEEDHDPEEDEAWEDLPEKIEAARIWVKEASGVYVIVDNDGNRVPEYPYPMSYEAALDICKREWAKGNAYYTKQA